MSISQQTNLWYSFSMNTEDCLSYSTKALKSEKPRIEPVKVELTQSGYNSILENIDSRFRIVLITQGTGSVEINKTLYPWISPCLICLNETDVIKFQNTETQIETNTLAFHPQFLHKKLNFENIRIRGMDAEQEVIENRLMLKPFVGINKIALLNHLPPEATNRIKTLITSASTELTQQETGWWPCRTRSYLTELLFFIVQLQENSQKNEISDINTDINISENFKPVLDFVMRKYNTGLTLEDIAKEFGTNRTTLNDKFKAETGMTAIAYIIDLRLRISAAMLVDTDLPVSEISDRIGSADVSHFERQFRKKYGMSPKNYRLTAKGAKN